jgi:hypothetical protein
VTTKTKKTRDFGTNAEGAALKSQSRAEAKCRRRREAGETHDTFATRLGNCYVEYGCRTCGFVYRDDTSD